MYLVLQVIAVSLVHDEMSLGYLYGHSDIFDKGWPRLYYLIGLSSIVVRECGYIILSDATLNDYTSGMLPQNYGCACLVTLDGVLW